MLESSPHTAPVTAPDEETQAPAVRLLVVTHYYAEHGGGVERVAAELAQRLGRRGFDVSWAASAEPPPKAAAGGPVQTPAAGGPVQTPAAGGPATPGWRRVPMRAWNVTERALGFPYPLWGPGSLWRLWREVRRSRVVHLHDCLYMGNFAAYVFARAARRPVLVTQHIGFVPYSRAILRLLLRLANRTLGAAVLRGCDRVVFYSPRVAEYFSSLLGLAGPPLLIANGVAAEPFHPVEPELRLRLRAELGCAAERPLLLFVGRFVEKKGLAVLHRLAAALPEPLWVFIGWGPDDPAAWKLPNLRVLPLMQHPELARAYQAADLLVLPSVGEGFPLVVQEAMACGTPALISRETAAGCPEIAPVTFTAEPVADDFAAALRQILSNRSALAGRRPDVAALARRLWSWDETTAAYARLLHALAGAATPPRDS
jgi:glycosyltransferase involved in cell wall biosynthesis